MVLETMLALNEAAKKFRIELIWIRAHMGYRGNEMADRLAKQGMEGNDTPADLPLSPASRTKKELKTRLHAKWMESWADRPDCRQTKQWLPMEDMPKTFKITNLGRRLFI